jgi:hypothetical protein
VSLLTLRHYRAVTSRRMPLNRAVAAALTWCVWPVGSVLFAPKFLDTTGLFEGVPVSALRIGALFASLQMSVEFVVVGAILVALTWLTARTSCSATADGPRAFVVGVLDAGLVACAVACGIAAELPALLMHPLFGALSEVPVSSAQQLLLVGVIGIFGVRQYLSGPDARLLPAAGAAVALAGLGWMLARYPPSGPAAGTAGDRQVVVLGIDSLGAEDDLEVLLQLTRRHGGVAFSNAVTPGLLTNSVWPAVLTGRYPSALGVFFVFQAPDWSRLPPTWVDRARTQGLMTESRFSDQFTTHVGSDLGFDVDRSGPRGWRQPISAAVKDASVFLPVILPWLGNLPGKGTPPNQSGTYAFSLRLELAEILAGRQESTPGLVVAHVDYLHQSRFPGLSELSQLERHAVTAAPVRALADRSLHWQYPGGGPDPIALYDWKTRHLQEVLAGVIEESGVLAPGRQNRLVLFSDHGPRTGLTEQEFAAERFYRVPLFTFGVVGVDPDRPISLIELGALLGFAEARPEMMAPPAVEYANATAEEWRRLVERGRPQADGGLSLDPEVLGAIGARLTRVTPTATGPQYRSTPASPSETRQAQGVLDRVLARVWFSEARNR